MTRKSFLWIVLLVFTSAGVALSAQDASLVVPVSLQVEQVEPLLTVGETVKGYKVPGLPEGFGFYKLSHGHFALLVSEGTVSGDISSYDVHPFFDSQGLTAIIDSAGLAFKKVYDVKGRRYHSRRGSLARLGGAFMAGENEGFNRDILVTGENEAGSRTFDGAEGGRALAVFNRRAYFLPRMGRYAKGAPAVLTGSGAKTIVVFPEAGGEAPDSNLYLYVGTKSSRGNEVERNGLANGRLYVMKVSGAPTEEALSERGKSYRFTFVPVSWDQSAAALKREASERHATGFISIGGCAQNLSKPSVLYFVSLGSDARGKTLKYVNHNGRLYRLVFDDLTNPTAGGLLTVLLSGTEGIVSPSSVAVNRRGMLLIGEAPTFPLPGRNTSVWSYKPKSGFLTRLLEVRTKRAPIRGGWTTTGVVDASPVLGNDWWLVAVHSSGMVKGTEVAGQVVALHTRG